MVRFLMMAAIMSVAAAAQMPQSASVAMSVEHNRVLVEVEFPRPDGSVRVARAWVDTGNPEFLISEEIARDIGMDMSGKREEDPGMGGTKIASRAPKLRLNGMALDTDGVATSVIAGRAPIFPGLYVDANLPSTILQRYTVVLDYPGKKFTMAQPGSLKPEGTRVLGRVHPKTGLIDMEATIAGQSYKFALDCGASYGLVAETPMTQWSKAHPEWARLNGSVGAANMWGIFPREAELPLLRAGEVHWGALPMRYVGFIGGPDGFATWYSQKTAEPVIGAIGGNALRSFRVQIDYAGQAVYFVPGAAFSEHDLDVVPVTIQPVGKSFQVLGVTRDSGGKPLVGGVERGDQLIAVGNLKTSGASMAAVTDALRGKPGEVRRLELERGGRRFAVEAKVARLW